MQATEAVACGTGNRSCALRTHPQARRHFIDPDDASAPAPDGLDVDLGQEVLVLVHDAPVRRSGFALVDNADVKRGSPHVGGDDVGMADHVAEILRAHHARDGTGIEGEERRLHRLRDRDRAPRTLGDLKPRAVALALELAIDRVQVAGGDGSDVGVERGGGGSFVLPPLGGELVGTRHEETRGFLFHDGPNARLVIGVQERPQRADRDGLAAGVAELPGGAARLLFVEVDHDLPETVDPLRNASDQALRYQRVGLLALRDVDHQADVAAGEAARSPHDVDHVVVAFGRDQADAGAPLLDDRVGSRRRAVGEQPQRFAKGVRSEAEFVRRRVHRRQHAGREVAGRGGHLARDEPPRLVHDHAVGEGAADIDAAEIFGHSLNSRAAGWPAGLLR